jgi:hypothetical protein
MRTTALSPDVQGVEKFRVKVGEGNVASLRLFSSKLGFVECGRSDYFKEITLEFEVGDGERKEALLRQAAGFKTGVYDGQQE